MERMSHNSNVTLAIESAVGGGSITLLRGDENFAEWTGKAEDISKAEDLLFNIDTLLNRAAIPPRLIGLLAVSAGPGSFTGIRIGLATALGLKAGLGTPLASVSALKAMAAVHSNAVVNTAALPVGRNAVCFQEFKGGTEITEPRTVSQEDFISAAYDRVITNETLFDIAGRPPTWRSVGCNLSVFVGRYCLLHPSESADPLFVSKTF